MTLVGLAVAIPLGFLGLAAEALQGLTFLVVAVAYPFLEGRVTARFNSTPGKWLFNIRLLPKGVPVHPGDHFRRARTAHFGGFAGGVPLFSLVAAWISWRHFLQTGRTRWDDAAPFYVVPQGVGFFRWSAFIALWIGLTIVGALATTAS
jgi:hypothetical protein